MKKLNVFTMLTIVLFVMVLSLSGVNKPDLEVTPIQQYYAQLAINQLNEFNFTVKNVGNIRSPTCRMLVQRGGSVKYEQIPELNPGSRIHCKKYASFSTPGNYIFRVIADVDDNVDELTNSNNKQFVSFKVSDWGKPDLYIRSFTHTSTTKVGQYVHLSFQVMNKLYCNVAPPSKCIVKIGGETFGKEYIIPKLNPGQGHNFSRGWTPPRAGNIIIKVIADSQNQIDEKDENNTRTRTITVTN